MRKWLVVGDDRRIYSRHFFRICAERKRVSLFNRANRPLKLVAIIGSMDFYVIHKDQLAN